MKELVRRSKEAGEGVILGKLVRFTFVLTAALAAWGLWLAEVCWVKGWTGLVWLWGFNWSSIPICFLIVLSCTCLVAPNGKGSHSLKFIGLGGVLTSVAFLIARWAVFECFRKDMFVPAAGPAVVLLIAGLGAPVGLTASMNRLLVPLHSWTSILVSFGLLLVLPLSFLTIRLFPAFNGSTDPLHSIKMGYPVFWTAVLVPISLQLGKKMG